MKPASSKLIDLYLEHVRDGLIVGKENTSGVAVVAMIEKALREILAGTPPNEALQIKRGPGGPQKARTIAMASEIHALRKNGIEWGAIHRIFEIYFQDAGLKPLSKERLKKIYAVNQEWLQGRDDLAEFVVAVQERLRPEK